MSNEAASIADLNETLLSEVLSYFTLNELNDSSRIVSKDFKSASQIVKEIILRKLTHSKDGFLVEIVGLQSAKGMTYNSKLGEIMSSKRTEKQKKSNRFAVQLVNNITGETEYISLKPCNINIYPPKLDAEKYEKQMKLLNYSNDAKVQVIHGMLLEQCLLTCRCNCNLIHGNAFYAGDTDSFMMLPHTHPAMYKCAGSMFSFWNVNPPGYNVHFPEEGVFDMTVSSLVPIEKQILQGFRSKWFADGENGELILRNYIRFMKSWKNERISGNFWVVKLCKTGTIMVKFEEGNDQEPGEVYLVRGMNSVIAELMPVLPVRCFATILPLYHFLVYDGMITGVANDQYFPVSPQFKHYLSTHVQNAIDQGTVITMGESAAQGKWDSIPPPLPYVPKDGEYVDSEKKEKVTEETKSCREFTATERSYATKIAKLVKEKGVLPSERLGHNGLCFRRMGYTVKENPAMMCLLLLNAQPFDAFSFKNFLTYTLEEVLDVLLNTVLNRCAMPPLLMIDEMTVVDPLRMLLDEYLEKANVKDQVKVQWYPPPTEEETQMAMVVGRMGM